MTLIDPRGPFDERDFVDRPSPDAWFVAAFALPALLVSGVMVARFGLPLLPGSSTAISLVALAAVVAVGPFMKWRNIKRTEYRISARNLVLRSTHRTELIPLADIEDLRPDDQWWRRARGDFAVRFTGGLVVDAGLLRRRRITPSHPADFARRLLEAKAAIEG